MAMWHRWIFGLLLGIVVTPSGIQGADLPLVNPDRFPDSRTPYSRFCDEGPERDPARHSCDVVWDLKVNQGFSWRSENGDLRVKVSFPPPTSNRTYVRYTVRWRPNYVTKLVLYLWDYTNFDWSRPANSQVVPYKRRPETVFGDDTECAWTSSVTSRWCEIEYDLYPGNDFPTGALGLKTLHAAVHVDRYMGRKLAISGEYPREEVLVHSTSKGVPGGGCHVGPGGPVSVWSLFAILPMMVLLALKIRSNRPRVGSTVCIAIVAELISANGVSAGDLLVYDSEMRDRIRAEAQLYVEEEASAGQTAAADGAGARAQTQAAASPRGLEDVLVASGAFRVEEGSIFDRTEPDATGRCPSRTYGVVVDGQSGINGLQIEPVRDFDETGAEFCGYRLTTDRTERPLLSDGGGAAALSEDDEDGGGSGNEEEPEDPAFLLPWDYPPPPEGGGSAVGGPPWCIRDAKVYLSMQPNWFAVLHSQFPNLTNFIEHMLLNPMFTWVAAYSAQEDNGYVLTNIDGISEQGRSASWLFEPNSLVTIYDPAFATATFYQQTVSQATFVNNTASAFSFLIGTHPYEHTLFVNILTRPLGRVTIFIEAEGAIPYDAPFFGIFRAQFYWRYRSALPIHCPAAWHEQNTTPQPVP